MPVFRIPDDLATLAAEQRLIPFVGAGFSGVHGLPGWEDLLRGVARDVQEGADLASPTAYESIATSCDQDNLRIAEYLYLITGGSIGPIRHAMSNMLRTDRPMALSTPHVELLNLGAPQVYTTNFDDLIERTYRELGSPADVVALPRDVARSHADRTQVVKYHGDLRHDETLVLTESQYYTRLEFESPMDLKFRSDLLGRAVLFVGYSFSDVNIRVIWFKLMQMMKDVPEKDRLPSYIVRLRRDEVLDTLYDAVGLRPVIIDPDGTATSREAQNALLSDFMLDLSMRASGARSKPTYAVEFVSPGLLSAIHGELETSEDRATGPRRRLVRARYRLALSGFAGGRLHPLLKYFASRRIPAELGASAGEVIDRLAIEALGSDDGTLTRIAIGYVKQFGANAGATGLIARGLMLADQRSEMLDDDDLPWDLVWSSRLDRGVASDLLYFVEGEVNGHFDEAEPYRDYDVAYAADVASRLATGALQVEGDDEALRVEAQSLLDRLAELYPAVRAYAPDPGRPPEPFGIADEIDALEESELAEAAIREDEEREQGTGDHDEDGDESVSSEDGRLADEAQDEPHPGPRAAGVERPH